VSEYAQKAVEAIEHTRVAGTTYQMIEAVGPGMRAIAYALLDLAAAIRDRG
jgi:hypothetical protein